MRTAILLMMAMSATAAEAQNLSTGLLSPGLVAVERTHHVRIAPFGCDYYLELGAERSIGKVRVAGFARAMSTTIVVWSCEKVPCEPIGRFNTWPGSDGITDHVLWTDLGVGVRQGWKLLDFGAGVGMTILSGMNPQYWGAVPMGVFGAWNDVSIQPVSWAGIRIGVGWIPPQNARWTTFDEWGGSVPYGPDRGWIIPIHAGIVVGSLRSHKPE